MVISAFNSGQLNLYELEGSEGNWGNKTAIDEVNNSDSEYFPVLGKAKEHNLLLFARFGSVGGHDIWYSVGNSTASIQPTSVGLLKAMFK